jgi:toluene monooxygenase electron transfer component
LRRLNENVLHLTLAINVPFVFLPGQFVVFNLPAPIGRRAYSMSNLPGEQGTLEFMIKRKPQGLATGYLFERLREGDTLSIEGPYGRAFLRDNLNDDRDIVLLAGGSGLAPVWSIGLGALKEGAARTVRLYFGVNTSSDLFWLDEMESARLKHPNLEVNVVLMQSSAADPPGCRVGMVAAILARDLDGALDADLYMAGPPGLIDFALREFVTTGRMRADRVYFDRFC